MSYSQLPHSPQQGKLLLIVVRLVTRDARPGVMQLHQRPFCYCGGLLASEGYFSPQKFKGSHMRQLVVVLECLDAEASSDAPRPRARRRLHRSVI